MRRVLLITNPVAARHDPGVLRTVSRTLDSLGIEVDVAGTTRHGDAARLAAQGVADKVDAIAVYGGDGTTMQAVSGMIGSGIPLALIPGGTGNLLAGNLRVPRSPARAARLVAEGVRRSIDIGSSERPDGTRHFAVAAGAGFDALIMEGATSPLKRRFGMAAYVISTMGLLNNVAPVHYKVTVDSSVIEVEAITVVVANCREVGPLFFSLGEGISLDDGYLDVIILSARGLVGGVVAMWDLFRGGGGRILRARGRSVTVEADSVRPVQMDGELAGTTPFNATVLRRAVDVLVPARSLPHQGAQDGNSEQGVSSSPSQTVHIKNRAPTEVV
jgi:YegS/Rv2252/BmrU family lipid kinase